MPERLYEIGQHTVINDSDIELNSNMVDRLRKI